MTKNFSVNAVLYNQEDGTVFEIEDNELVGVHEPIGPRFPNRPRTELTNNVSPRIEPYVAPTTFSGVASAPSVPKPEQPKPTNNGQRVEPYIAPTMQF